MMGLVQQVHELDGKGTYKSWKERVQELDGKGRAGWEGYRNWMGRVELHGKRRNGWEGHKSWMGRVYII